MPSSNWKEYSVLDEEERTTSKTLSFLPIQDEFHTDTKNNS
jgi:hypothetical protein